MSTKKPTQGRFFYKKFGGDMRDRTADLFTASEALSQLSYAPKTDRSKVFNLVKLESIGKEFLQFFY